MSSMLIYLSFYLITNSVLFCYAQIITPCKVNDDTCVTRSAKAALPIIVDGIPSAGVEASDPLYIDKVLGDISILKYTFTNSTVTGLKKCDINNVELDLDKSNLHFDLWCSLLFQGQYNISGRLIILPVEGDGTYVINSKKYQIGVNCDVKKVQGKDGIAHLKINSFKLTIEAMDGVKYTFENLFHGRQDLSDAVHMFANSNWKEVADLLQEPVFIVIFKKIVSNLNKYFKSVPFDDMFIE